MSDAAKPTDFREARSRDLGAFMIDALSPADDSLTAERLKTAYLCGMADTMRRISAGEEPCYKLLPHADPLLGSNGRTHATADETGGVPRTADETGRTQRE